MRILLIALSLTASISIAYAQGTVQFANTPTTLVSAGPVGLQTAISGQPGSYYFGLLIAPPGTVDLAQFTFTGVYATNSGIAGRLGSIFYVPAVVGWLPLEFRSYFVAGWSSSLGHDWSQGWLSGEFDSVGFFGLSSVGTGYAGGPSGGVPAPALQLFGPVSGTYISTGFNLDPVPEASSSALLALGTAVMMLRPRLRNKKGNTVGSNDRGARL